MRARAPANLYNRVCRVGAGIAEVELSGALDGIEVLDLTHHVAGPYCTKLLADFGARVTKVERPGSGDPARRMGPFAGDDPHSEKSLPFLYLNTNKRSATLDFKTDTGRALLKRMAAGADLVVENFRPRSLPAARLSYSELSAVNPSVVMVSISNFGQTGPYRDFEATDIVEYALSGIQYIFGDNDREPLKHGFDQAQYKAGTDAAAAALIALYHRAMTGEGQWVDVSIQECIATGLRDTTSAFTYTGAVKWRRPNETGDLPRSPVATKDGYIVPIAFGGAGWNETVEFLGSDALRDERFSTAEGRMENAAEVDRILRETFAQYEKSDLFHRANRVRGLIYGLVQDSAELYENPQYEHRGYFVEVDHPIAGKGRYPGAPFGMSDTGWSVRSHAPLLGQHNVEVYVEEMGLSMDELRRLTAAGVV